MVVLKRYSKAHGAGDQTSGGRGKLLKSTTNLSRTELLVRETLQNSWDARDEGWTPAFGVRLHRLGTSAKTILREQILKDTGNLVSLRRLDESLNDDDTYVLEIYDRGTVGLNGPIRANEAAGPGEPNNFNPLVFDIGTSKDDEASGGTYGFGKTAAFESSACHTVVYWSATENQRGKLEHRLIASSLGQPYEIRGQRYTGAHWWGDPEENGIVPLVADSAQQLGESIFKIHFGEIDNAPEKGTSILIIDPLVDIAENEDSDEQRVPVRTEEHASALIQQIAEAVSHHAWPKVIPDSSGETPMIVEVHHGDANLDITESIQRRYAPYGAALTYVRQAQGENYSDSDSHLQKYPGLLHEKTFEIKLRETSLELARSREEFYGSRSDRVVGHLTLMRSAHITDDQSDRILMNRLALMRSSAELIVTYDDMRSEDAGDLSWHGVFKPTPEVDRHFAACEPSTHDAWTPNIAPSEVSKSVVDRAQKLIRKRLSEFLDSNARADHESGLSMRKFANSLRAFAPAGSIDPNELTPTSSPRRSSGRGKSNRELVTIVGHREIPRANSLTPDQEIQFRVSPRAARPVEVRIAVVSLTPEGKIPVEDSEYEVAWYKGDLPVETAKAFTAEPSFEGRVVLRISFASQTSVSITGTPTA